MSYTMAPYAYAAPSYGRIPSKPLTVLLHFLFAGSGLARLYNGCRATGVVQLAFALMWVFGMLTEEPMLTSVGLVAMTIFFLVDTVILAFMVTLDYDGAGALCTVDAPASSLASFLAMVTGLAGAGVTIYTALYLAPWAAKTIAGVDIEPIVGKPPWVV